MNLHLKSGEEKKAKIQGGENLEVQGIDNKNLFNFLSVLQSRKIGLTAVTGFKQVPSETTQTISSWSSFRPVAG